MAEELNLKVDQNVYESAISRLEGYVQKLYTLLTDYQTKRTQVDEIWQDEEADKYKEAIDVNITKVQEAIDATNTQIYQLRKLLDTKSSAKTVISSVVDEAVEIAQYLF